MVVSANIIADEGGAHAPRPRTLTLGFSERRVPVQFIDAVEVAVYMHDCLHDWEIAEIAATDDPPVTVRATEDGYTVESIWLDEPVVGLTDVAAACCALIDVIECLLDADHSLLCLHCAAAEIGGQLVVMTGPSHVGKSTLASRLSAEDLVLFCDDMLPLDTRGRGIAVGLGPRLRLPLPAAAAPEFREHVARHMGPTDERYGYLNAPTVAGYGRRAPIGAIVLLDRRPDGPARFRKAAPAEALGFLIEQNLAMDREPEEMLDRLRRLAGGALCLRLEYSDLEDVTALIMQTFAQWPPRDLKVLPALAEKPREQEYDAPIVEPDPARPFVRRRDVAVRHFGGELFLSHAEERRILRLNEVGGAVWTLLDAVTTPDEIAGDLAVAFPDVPRTTIDADVRRLMGEMHAFALIREADAVSGGADPR